MKLDKLFNSKVDRRRVLGNLGMMGAGAVLTACGTNTMGQDNEEETMDNDVAILNFALNLEYLEAAFYLAAVGRLDEMNDIPGFENIVAGASADGNPSENFEDEAVRAYADEIATDELNHVRFLRTALGDAAVDIPAINIAGGAEGAFGVAASEAGRVAGVNADTQTALATFDPYANQLFFIHGAFIFEDVGVTAYKGASPLVTNKGTLEAAAGILAVEAYHAGEIRTLLYAEKDTVAIPAGAVGTSVALDVKGIVGAISALRAALGNGKDQGIVNADGSANIVLADPETSIAYSRSPREVLNIVYGAAGAANGLFFPDGLNGDFSALLG